ncbi:MAG: WD40 repeat protein/predicted Ser/Thr protein kinase [Verrucomicrobiales bacterium]
MRSHRTSMTSTRLCQSCGSPVSADAPCVPCSLLGVVELIASESDAVAGPKSSRESVGFTRLELPSTFGPYRIEREIAAGGMGIVYEAEDMRLHRRVALKMLRQVLFATEQEQLRFYSEAELASLLDHPNIVPIFDVGKFEGQPFFAMKYVDGGNLADRLAAGALPMREAADLMVTVAHAVHYAHQRGILHRDLKPANILIDASGKPWLTDFGLAKLLDTDSGLTLTQAIAGTPHYMAPEQARGNKKDISTATDVWALGVIFYETLTGSPPFQAETNTEILRQVAESEPPAPSTVIRTIDQDLQTLCLRCLDKDPARRLSSAGDLAEELERWQRGEPIRARRITALERTSKWMRRHPYRAALLTAFMLMILSATSAITWQWRRAEASAEIERRTAYSATLAQALAVRKNHDFGQARRLLDGIDPELRGFDWRLLNSLCRGDEKLAYRLGEGLGATPQCFTLLPNGEHLAILSADGHLHIRDLQGTEVVPPRALPSASNDRHGYYGLTISPDGQRLAYGQDDVLRVLEADTLTLLYETSSRSPQFDWLDNDRLLYGFNGSVATPPYPAAGAWILDFRDIHAFSVAIPRFPFPEMCAPLAVSPDRKSFVLHRVSVSGSWGRTLHVYKTAEDLTKKPQRLYSMPGSEYPGDLAFSHSGRYLAFTAGEELSRSARVLEVSTGEVLFNHEFRFPIHRLAIDPDERHLGLVGDDSSVRVYDFTRGSPVGENTSTYDDEVSLAHSQPVSGRGAHAPPRDLTTRSAQDGRAIFYLGHEKSVLDVAFDLSGSLITGSNDGTLRHWPVGIPRPGVRLSHAEGGYSALHPAASVDGHQVIYSTHFQFVRVCEVARSRGGQHASTLPVSSRYTPLAVLQDGTAITQDKVTTEVVLWAMRDGQMREQKRLPTHCANSMHDGRTRSGVLSADEKRLAGSMNGWLFSADLERGTMVWSGSLGKRFSSYASHDLSPDGQWIASTDFGSRVTIHRFTEPNHIVTTLGSDSHSYDTAVAFGRDGRRLYVGNGDGRIRVWDTTTWKEIPELSWQAQVSAVTAIALSNDRTLIATSGDSTLRLFPIEPEPGQPRRRERISFQLDQAANWIHFARSETGGDRALLHSVPNGTLEIWEADRDQKLTELPEVELTSLPLPLWHHAATLLPSGKLLVAGGESIEAVALSASHLFDPTTGTWLPTGPMRRPRSHAMMTLLSSGKVLVAGGKTRDYIPLASCELYDPDTGIWTPTGSMASARFQGLPILLQNNLVLIVGGSSATSTSCELYDSNKSTWTPTGSLSMQDRVSMAVLVADGSVLAINGSHRATRAERYDPASGIWNAVDSSLPARHGSTTTLLRSGELLVAGGENHPTCHLFDPLTGAWRSTGSLPLPRDFHTETLLPSGKVLVAGGKAQTTTYISDSPTVNTCLLYDPIEGTWSPAPDFEHPRSQHTATLLKNGKILFVGGRDEKGGPTKSVEVYEPER